MSRPRLVVSACLLGRACRYDGDSRARQAVLALAERAELVPVCPEELGGMGTPRPAAELKGGDGRAALAGLARVARVQDHVDVTREFVAGARAAMKEAGPVQGAVLKARSPSCGVGVTCIDGAKRTGDGVFAALLGEHAVPRCTDEDLERGALPVGWPLHPPDLNADPPST